GEGARHHTAELIHHAEAVRDVGGIALGEEAERQMQHGPHLLRRRGRADRRLQARQRRLLQERQQRPQDGEGRTVSPSLRSVSSPTRWNKPTRAQAMSSYG